MCSKRHHKEVKRRSFPSDLGVRIPPWPGVQSLVREVRTYKCCSAAGKRKKERKKVKNFSTEWKKILVNLKMGKRFGYTFLQRRFANG